MCKGDIHCILHVECYARRFHRRMIQTRAKNATFCSILTKTERYLACVGDISTFNCYIHRTLHSECYVLLFLASKQSQLCAKCDHLLHFEENWGLYRICWRYFDVYTLFPLHFTRRMLCTPVFGVGRSRPVRKMRQFTLFWRQTERSYAIVGDISPFKRYCHSTLRAECYVRRF